MFLRKKNGIARQRLTESAGPPVVYFGQAESLWRKAKETCQWILNKREDTQCGSIMTEI